jgi:hypothetical protein
MQSQAREELALPAIETVTPVGWGKFVVHSKDHSPPHVHVRLNDRSEYRIDLISGEFMDSAPAPGMRRKIMKAYNENIERIWSKWEEMHPGDS